MLETKLMVTKRTGELVEFDVIRIKNAILKAVQATGQQIGPNLIDKIVDDITNEVEQRFIDFFPNVENIQDIVEKHLVMNGLYEIAKAYILYRANRQKLREQEKEETISRSILGKLTVKKRDSRNVLFNIKKIQQTLVRISSGIDTPLDENALQKLAREVVKNLYDGVTTAEIENALVLAATTFIEKDPVYDIISARLLMQKLYREVIGYSIKNEDLRTLYRKSFINGIKTGVECGLLDKRLLNFDLEYLSQQLVLERDEIFTYLGIRTLYDRYFMSHQDQRIETPQAFWMRVAMGLAINEDEPTDRTLEFYDVMSTLRYIPSTPTLFFSGSVRPQLSSCYLTTIGDDLSVIFKCLGDNAQLAKWSGGIGNDWSYIRATGALIKGTQAFSQGIVPFLKIANDTTVISKTGKRRGGTCGYLETWHLDIEEFLMLRKNTGDERRRTHDLNTANWIPDLFMKRVLADEQWTLFSPDETPELHDLYGRKFEKKYEEYEEKARNGKLHRHKVVSAKKLWRKMLSMLFETGHPWITFKDPCNVRSPQDHCGVVHSSNLCTEITLNTSVEETAVCNLGSINIKNHIKGTDFERELLAKTTKTAIRMLDNVIDINFYPTPEACTANMRHRPVGLGIMGLQDALFMLNLPFDSPATTVFNNKVMEFISYHAILASSELAKERGSYESFLGSKWDRGILPHDTVEILEQERGMEIQVTRESYMDWEPVREHIQAFGMRNSNTMAIAPTATISNIAGCYPSIEPIYKNIYVKANVSGEFTIINEYLVNELKKRNLWNEEMLHQIKYYDGSIEKIPMVPSQLKKIYKEAFEIDPVWLVKHAAVRAKWIDQSQSLNIFMRGTSGKQLNDIYIAAWETGVKTTYYLRSLGASQIEKSTLDSAKFGFNQKRSYETAQKHSGTPHAEQFINISADPIQVTIKDNSALDEPSAEEETREPKLCLIGDPDCESCQ
ncbi:MAG: ribonucleoside-diphosphate reductase subunit alpha [bacterium]|nr:ribonucleoside-diphosphate reductase subunit alpha [bacterium]